MLQPIIVVFECTACVVWRVNANTSHPSGELLLQCLQSQQVVTEDEPIIEDVLVRHAVRRVVRSVELLHENTWLQPWPVLLPDPRQFQPLLVAHSRPSSG